ncbi:MAG: Uncharacterised protein [Flavobacteriales bacterium UBA4585]|nr:MAG: Uncharacterised protein [Flavobacteriales bacterium UBA4585]
MSSVKLLLSPILISAPAAPVLVVLPALLRRTEPVKLGLKLMRLGGFTTRIPSSTPLWRDSLSKFLFMGFQLYKVRVLRMDRLILNPQGFGFSSSFVSGMRNTR